MKKEHLKRLAIIYVIAMIYPIFKGIKENSLMPVSDSTFIMSLTLLIFGLLSHVGRLGAFDSTIYIFKRNFKHYEKTYDVYLEDIKEKKKDSFNYPLFLGILLLITAIVTNFFI